MDSIKRRFMSTPLGVQERERNGTCVSRLKERLFGGRLAEAQSLYKRDLRGHFGCVNAIEFSTDGELIASGGDDRRLLLWNIGQTMFDDKAPHVIDTLHVSNINTCCFDADNRAVATGGNDGQVIVHDINVRQSTAVYGLSDAVYCLSPDPINSTIIATATDDGKAQIIDLRMSIDTAPFVLADLSTAMHSVMFNPAEPRLLATANSKHGIGLWDVRMPLKCLQYKSNVQNCMSVRFNSHGDQLVALRRRSSPVLYDIAKLHPIHEFDYKTYYNACTLKSCSFAGLKDEYVMSGSDDFCIYLWKIPSHISDNYTQSQPHMILKGHRSIVNQVRFCPYNQTIISSGVEKLIKLWSPYYIPGCTGHLTHSRRYGDDDETERNAYSHEEYIHMVLQAGSFLSHDYSNGSTDEEPCMIAFFDSLIQREIEQSVEGDDEGQDSHDDVTSHDDDSDGGQREAGQSARVRSFNNDDDDQQVVGVPGKVRPSGDIVSSHDGANSSSSMVTESEDASNTRDTSLSSSSRLEDSSRPFFLDLQSSSDSEGEVDVILSAMYSRYMSARERALNSNLRPSGKKISSVIAKGKQRDRTLQTKMRSHRRQRIRKNMTSMSILADVIDTFVDSLVATGPSNSQTLSDTNDGHLSTDSGERDSSSTPVDVIQQTLTLHTDDTASATSSVTTVPPLSRPAVTHDSASVVPAVPASLQPGMYFMPELEIFGPDSFNTARFANLPDAYLSGYPSRHIRPLDVSSRSRHWVVRPQPLAESAHSHTWDNSSSTAHIPALDNSSVAQSSAVDGCISSNHSSSSGGGGGGGCGQQCSSTPACVTKSGTSSWSAGASAGRHSGVASDLVDQTSLELNKQHMPAPSTSAGDLVWAGEHNQRLSSPSSSTTRSRQHLGPLWSADGTAGAPAHASSTKPVSVQFKKAKVAGKRFRIHKSEPSSSSDEN